MTRSKIAFILTSSLTILFALHQRQKMQKAGERQTRMDLRGQVPMSLEEVVPDSVALFAGIIARAAGWVAFGFLTLCIVAVAIATDDEPLVRWVLIATLVAIELILLVWVIQHRRRRDRDAN